MVGQLVVQLVGHVDGVVMDRCLGQLVGLMMAGLGEGLVGQLVGLLVEGVVAQVALG